MSSEPDIVVKAQQHKTAADSAYAATLWSDAAREYEAALSLMSGTDDGLGLDEPELLTNLGACYWSMSEARTGWRTLRRAMQLYRERGDGLGLALATVQVLRIWGPWERQQAMADDALELLGPDGDPYLRARLLLSTAWRGRDDRFDQAMAIAEEHGFEDLLTQRTQNDAFVAYRETGDIDAMIETSLRSFETYARLGVFQPATMTLRQTGFGTIEHGLLDRGSEIAWKCVEHARSFHLKFDEELALTDLAGVHFARADYDGCNDVLCQLTTNTDFRADLYRMWVVERSGDTKAAVQMMVDPDRAGRAATGMSQTHAAAAGVLYRAGLEDPARRELEQWAEIGRPNGDMGIEAPVLFECIAALGDDALVAEVVESYEAPKPGEPRAPTFAVLSGRAVAPTHGALLTRLLRFEDAERVYREGLDWCERERTPIDAGLCLGGLGGLAMARGETSAAEELLSRARNIFTQHGALLYLPRVSP